MTDLSALPHDHPLRNKHLGAIGAQYRWTGGPAGKGWRSVGPTWKIARVSYNDLGTAWTQYTQWRCRDE